MDRDQGAIGSPLGLLRRGSHDGLPVGEPHGLKPRSVPQCPWVRPAGVFPWSRGLLRVTGRLPDRQLQGGEIGTAYVSSGSFRDSDAADLNAGKRSLLEVRHGSW